MFNSGGFGGRREPREGDIARVLETNRFGDPVVWEDPFGNVFGVDEYGKVVLLQPSSRGPAARQPMFNQQQSGFGQTFNQSPGFNQGFGNRSSMGFNNNLTAGFGSQTSNPVSNSGKRPGFMSEASKVQELMPQQPIQQQEIYNSAISNREPKIFTGYKPEPGSEYIPIYDPEIEKLDIVFDHDRKVYKFVIVKK